MVEERVDFALIGSDARALARCKSICEEFEYSFQDWAKLDSFVDCESMPKLVVAYPPDMSSKESAAEAAQAVRFKCRDAFLICVVSGRLGTETAAFAKKSGANLIVLEDELYGTSKLEFAATQVVRADFIPIKPTDLAPGIVVPFDVYHLMPLRRKFLKIAAAGTEFASEKILKLGEVGEIYIRKSAVELFNQYIESNQDRSAKGLARRCRSQFLALYASYMDMAFLLTDQSEYASFDRGAELLKHCRDLGSNLLMTLGEFGNAWDIVNNSTIGECGSAERAPAIAAYAALFALQMDLPDIEEIMTAALLADLGLLLLPPEVSKKMRVGSLDDLTAEELNSYRGYPHHSLGMILSRKLPVGEKLRELLISTHERADGTGFPRGITGRKLTEGAQLIQFCREFDRRTVVSMGQARVDREEMRKKIILDELNHPARFSPVFSEKLKKAFV